MMCALSAAIYAKGFASRYRPVSLSIGLLPLLASSPSVAFKTGVGLSDSAAIPSAEAMPLAIVSSENGTFPFS